MVQCLHQITVFYMTISQLIISLSLPICLELQGMMTVQLPLTFAYRKTLHDSIEMIRNIALCSYICLQLHYMVTVKFSLIMCMFKTQKKH